MADYDQSAFRATFAPIGQEYITIQVRGVKQVAGDFNRYNKVVRQRLAQVITATAERVASGARAAARSVTGRLRSSITRRQLDKDGLSQIVRPAAKHGGYVEFGTGPLGAATQREAPEFWGHKPEAGFPNIRKIGIWARAKGLTTAFGEQPKGKSKVGAFGQIGAQKATRRQEQRLAFLIARSIKRRGGLRARPFILPIVDEEAKTFVRNVQEVLTGSAPREAGVEVG
jgi:hypothetical protein